VETEGGQTRLRGADGWTVALSDANGRKAKTASTRAVVLGARHGTIRLHQEQRERAVLGRIYTVEPTGDITYAYVALGSVNLVVSVPPSVLLAPDDPVWLTFDQERLHLFDGESQQALSAA
jgi:multiple sugar transport system ATP-binding protein